MKIIIFKANIKLSLKLKEASSTQGVARLDPGYKA